MKVISSIVATPPFPHENKQMNGFLLMRFKRSKLLLQLLQNRFLGDILIPWVSKLTPVHVGGSSRPTFSKSFFLFPRLVGQSVSPPQLPSNAPPSPPPPAASPPSAPPCHHILKTTPPTRPRAPQSHARGTQSRNRVCGLSLPPRLYPAKQSLQRYRQPTHRRTTSLPPNQERRSPRPRSARCRSLQGHLPLSPPRYPHVD
jgi:hypothetical protein